MIPDGNVCLISETAADHKFNEFVSLMQDIPANEEFPEESNTVQEEISDMYIYTEELASLIEEIPCRTRHMQNLCSMYFNTMFDYVEAISCSRCSM